MSESKGEWKGASIADRAPLFTLGAPSHLFTWLVAPFRQRGLVDFDRPKDPRAASIAYGICVGLVAEWIRLYAQFSGQKEAEHLRTRALATSSRELAIQAQVVFELAPKGSYLTANAGAIAAALKRAKVKQTIRPDLTQLFNVNESALERLKAFVQAQVSSQATFYIFVVFLGAGLEDAHAVAGYHEASAGGSSLRIFEPNFGEFVVPYADFGTFWTDLRLEYRQYRDRAGALRPKDMSAIAVHVLA